MHDYIMIVLMVVLVILLVQLQLCKYRTPCLVVIHLAHGHTYQRQRYVLSVVSYEGRTKLSADKK